jgi:alpha-beta hydrolase superfamily lysophospholipase
MHTLRTTIQGQEQGLPYFMLGHSMGSYMLRKYLCLHGEGVAGAVIMGTGTVPDATTNMGLFVCRVLEKIYGDHHRSNLVRKLSYTKSYRSYDCYGKDLTKSWLSKNVENIRSYAADPRCTFTFTVNGYQGLMEAVQYDNQMEHITQTPRDLPLLFVSGALDPVGDLGEGVKTVYQMYQKAGFSDVTMKLYEDDRHEILNELDRELVYADLGAWLTRKGNE